MVDLYLPGGAAEHRVELIIKSHVELTSERRGYTMRATRLSLRWTWHKDTWSLGWSFRGHRWRKTTGDWSPHEQGFMDSWEIDLPDWVKPLIEANAPTIPPVVTIGVTLTTPAEQVGALTKQTCVRCGLHDEGYLVPGIELCRVCDDEYELAATHNGAAAEGGASRG